MEKDSSTENKVLSNKLKDHFKDNIKLALKQKINIFNYEN